MKKPELKPQDAIKIGTIIDIPTLANVYIVSERGLLIMERKEDGETNLIPWDALDSALQTVSQMFPEADKNGSKEENTVKKPGGFFFNDWGKGNC